MIVYLVTNKKNGKQYVGQTTKRLEFRWRGHLSASRTKSTYYFHKALRKYGEESFSIEQLHTCETKEEMDFVEMFYISLLKTKAPNGYNSTDGGEGSLGAKFSEEWYRKQRLSHKGNSYAKGHKVSEEARKIMSVAKKGKPSPLIGYKHTEEAKENMSRAHKGISINLGYKHTEAARKNMSLSHRGKPSLMKGRRFSEEARQNMDTGQKARRERERAKKQQEAYLDFSQAR